MRTLQGAQILLPGSKERMEVGLLTSESLPLSLLSVPLAPAGKQQRPERERETAGEELKEWGWLFAGVVTPSRLLDVLGSKAGKLSESFR